MPSTVATRSGRCTRPSARRSSVCRRRTARTRPARRGPAARGGTGPSITELLGDLSATGQLRSTRSVATAPAEPQRRRRSPASEMTERGGSQVKAPEVRGARRRDTDEVTGLESGCDDLRRRQGEVVVGAGHHSKRDVAPRTSCGRAPAGTSRAPLPELTGLADALTDRTVVLDGELVAGAGRADDFYSLTPRMALGPARAGSGCRVTSSRSTCCTSTAATRARCRTSSVERC